MKIARILYPVKNLGPGNRIGIWMRGCNRFCKGCANPELWDGNAGGDISPEAVRDAVKHLQEGDYPPIDGVTISGGEPFLQPEALRSLIGFFLEEGVEDILVFTGFLREELQEQYPDILDKIAVLVDGPYMEDRNEGHPLKGSSNQSIHYIREESACLYDDYIAGEMGRKRVQMFPLADGKVATGIHDADFEKEYQRLIREKK